MPGQWGTWRYLEGIHVIKTSRALVVAAATSVLALTSGAAYAQSYSHVDAAGDMYDDAGVVVPTATNGDVTNISVDYTKKSLTATMTFTDLDAMGSNEAGGGIVVINPRTKKFYLAITAAGSAGEDHFFIRSKGKAGCKKMVTSVDTTLNTVTIVLPKKCIDSSKRVFVVAGGMSSDGTLDAAGDLVMLSDDAFMDGFSEMGGVSPVIAKGGNGVIVDSVTRSAARTSLHKALRAAFASR